jgi:release factor glutamine methyltransferase
MDIRHGGLLLRVPDSVYLPADDSFMLADAARDLAGEVLEIGCGCGIVSLMAAKTAKTVFGTDINPDAVSCSKANAEKNGIGNATFAEADLFSVVKDRQFDAILFNPPYLPTDESEHVHGQLDRAFDGGTDGRAVLERFLAGFGRHLRAGGSLFLVQSSLNDLGKTRSILRAGGYRVDIMAEKPFFFERLYILKAQRSY